MEARSSSRRRKQKVKVTFIDSPTSNKVPQTSEEMKPRTTAEASKTPTTRSRTLQRFGESKPTKTKRSPTSEESPSSSRASSPALSTTSNTPRTQTSQPAPDYKEIPANLATQKAFYNLLVTTLGLKSVRLRVNYNKTALLITKTPLAPNFLKTLQVAANSTSINYAPINRKTADHSSAPKKPTFSVVIRDVPQDISADDIGTLCPSLSIVKAWRIISRKTNRATSFIRVLSTDNKTVDDMLINGVVLYGRTFECETSHPPTPTPLQCPRCFQFGHGQADCTNKPICPKCPESHPPNRCPPALPVMAPTLHGRGRAPASKRSK
jgi:hypothetical protein